MYDLGEIAELARIALPQVCVVTNVGPQSPGTHWHDRAESAQARWPELATGARPKATKMSGYLDMPRRAGLRAMAQATRPRDERMGSPRRGRAGQRGGQ